jgi:hypothetical protein
MYHPTLGRWVQRDPLGYVDGMSVYAYAKSGPTNARDPLGLFVEKDKVCGSMQDMKNEIWDLMKKKAGSDKNSDINDVDWLEMGRYLSANMKTNRYVWTKKGGWIDLKHFLRAAYEANRTFVTHGMVLGKGEDVEKAQAAGGNVSAWGVEDLPSNKYGVEFEPHIPDCNTDLPDALEKYINDVLGGLGTPPKDKIDKMNYIRNFTYEPIMSPDDKDIHVDEKTTIPFKGDPNDGTVKKQLKVMGEQGISGDNYGGTGMGGGSDSDS